MLSADELIPGVKNPGEEETGGNSKLIDGTKKD
jgi:hypothetical protein